MWLYLGIISACFLGFYDVSRKHALKQNATLPVLFLATICGALMVTPAILLSRFAPDCMHRASLFIPHADFSTHLHIFAKSALVAASWMLSYLAVKNLPISIVMPIGATSPVWTLLGAFIIFHEHLNPTQYLGFAFMVISYYWFSTIGKKEGIIFYNNKWILCILLAAILGSTSALYDKYMIQTLSYSPLVLQVWFSIYIVPVLAAVVVLFWMPNRKKHTPFVWRWSIPVVAALLIAADGLYFRALNNPQALVSLLSTIRASGVVISFVAGGLIFRELRLSLKAIALVGVIAGICLILLST